MRKLGKRICLGALCAATMTLGAGSPAAQGAAGDPIVFVPRPSKSPGPLVPPPTGYLSGPCGLAVDTAGNFYVSDYYHHAVDVYGPFVNVIEPWESYLGQLPNVDPIDGPCGLALDSTDRVYVNNFHRNVARFGASPNFGVGTTIVGAPLDASRPTGVAVNPATNDVYVNERTYIAVFDSTGAPVMDGLEPLRIGLGTLGEGFGLAFSRFPGTLGRLYVPDASTNTVKVYDPAIDKVNPVATLNGPGGSAFSSLRDSAVAIDRVSGDVYVADNVQPQYTEKPQATIYVYTAGGGYKGHLKYNITDALPPGLAVDNSPIPPSPITSTQGRVYVTSGNTDRAGVYIYAPGATTTSPPLPPAQSLSVSASGAGTGTVSSAVAGIECTGSCVEPQLAGVEVPLTATPGPGSDFVGWSGGGCSGTGACTVQMDQATSVHATFEPSPSPAVELASPAQASAPVAARPRPAKRHHRLKRHHRAKHRQMHRRDR